LGYLLIFFFYQRFGFQAFINISFPIPKLGIDKTYPPSTTIVYPVI